MVNCHSSNWAPVLSGVPQGSILGPLLFIIYTNDISSTLKSSLKLFADDMALYHHIKFSQDCSCFQDDLNTISIWFDTWQMALNPTKCEAICISNKPSPPVFQYCIMSYFP